jgi:5-hydroxyisourate hydrolase-like protein (transthyretin family)
MKLVWLVFASMLLQTAGGTSSALQGQVVAAGTEQPVPRARVLIAKVGGTAADYRTEVADESGRFAVGALSAGSYRVYAERQGYLRGEHGRRAPNVAGTPVAIVAGQSPPAITITMIPTGVITGRVSDDRRPARNVWVRAMKATFFDGERSLSIAEYAKTDDLGEYRLFGLAPGSYFVSALPEERPRIAGSNYVVPAIPSNANGNRSSITTPGPQALSEGLLDADALRTGIFLPVFYPGTTDATVAFALDVQPGATLTGIDLTIASASTVRVRGRVVDGTTGNPAPGVVVAVAPQAGRTVSINGATTDAAGAFELPAVPPGSYELIARTTSSTRLFGTLPVEVGERDLEAPAIVINPGTTLNGRVTVTGGSSGNGLTGTLVQLMGVGGMPGYSATQVKPDGTFSVENVESRDYRVRFVRQGRFLAPASVRLGAEDVTGRFFRVGPETAGIPLELVLSAAAGALDATVVDSSQRPVPGTTVALVPEPPRRNQSSLYRTAATDAFGRIRLEDVVAGDYKLFVADLDPASWQDPDVISRYESRGERVRITDGGRQNVTLRLPR